MQAGTSVIRPPTSGEAFGAACRSGLRGREAPGGSGVVLEVAENLNGKMEFRPDPVGSMSDQTAPHRPFPPELERSPPGLISAASAAVAALSELERFPAAADAAKRALDALSQLDPIVFHLPSAGEGAVGRESVGNDDTTGGQGASGVEQHGRDSMNGASQVSSSHEASKSLGINASNQQEYTAWCETCQVGCNSFQILEQHKNGKRHKKNLQRTEELRRIVRVSANMQDQGTSGVGAVIEGEAAGSLTEPSDQRSSPCKKRQSIGNGTIAKRAKNVVGPIVCSVCNVKCDTQEVFNKHLSGKKHISKVKHYQARQPRTREMGLRAVYLNYPASQIPPSQGSEYQFLIPGGSYLPPMPQAYTPLLPQVHNQVDTAGNTSAGPFQQHSEAQGLDGSGHNISPAVPGVQQW